MPYVRAKAVARLLIGGTSACTGWLIGSEGHLLTNEHCIHNASDAASLQVMRQLIGAPVQLAISQLLIAMQDRDGVWRALRLLLEQLVQTQLTRIVALS